MHLGFKKYKWIFLYNETLNHQNTILHMWQNINWIGPPFRRAHFGFIYN
jgi:hypothetical protein